MHHTPAQEIISADPPSVRLTIAQSALATLALIFGLQLFRVFPVPLIWYYGQSILNDPQRAALVLCPVPVLIACAPLIQRALGTRRTALLAAVGLALMRMAVQVTSAPQWDMALSVVGLIFLSWWLLAWTQSASMGTRSSNASILVTAIPLAFMVDTAGRSLLFDYDLAWRSTRGAYIETGLFVVALIALAWVDARRSRPDAPHNAVRPAAWLGIGAWLYLALNVTQNGALLVSLSGLQDTVARWLMNTISILGVLGSIRVRHPLAPRTSLAAGIALIMSVVLLSTGATPVWLWFALTSLLAWMALQELLVTPAPVRPAEPVSWRSSIAMASTWIILAALLLLDYFPPWGNLAAVTLLAAMIVWLNRRTAAIVATTGAPQRIVTATAVLIWLIISLWAILDQRPQPVQASAHANTLRVMTYNIHHGTDAGASMNLQEIANVIAAENPDVVALNEVSRGYISTGYVDTLWLISRRLGMPYILGMSNTGGRFGNAILSRYPIRRWDNTYYQHLGTEVRGILQATVDTPIGTLSFYATHLDHRPSPYALRSEQTQELLALWADQPRTVILGDLNAKPDEPDLRAIYAAGFTDVLAVTGQEDAFTFWNPVPQPGHRIDYIFLTPDLTVTRAWIPQTRASDHLPVVAEIRPTP